MNYLAMDTTNGTTKSDQPYGAFTITQEGETYVVTQGGEWIATFGSSYRANLYVACIAS